MVIPYYFMIDPNINQIEKKRQKKYWLELLEILVATLNLRSENRMNFVTGEILP